MTKEKLEALARKARQMAEALQAATEGKYETKTSREMWNEYGADTAHDSAKVYQTDEFLAIWSQDGSIEVWDFENFEGESPSINLQTGKATF